MKFTNRFKYSECDDYIPRSYVLGCPRFGDSKPQKKYKCLWYYCCRNYNPDKCIAIKYMEELNIKGGVPE